MDRHYHIRSNTVMISLNFNSYVSFKLGKIKFISCFIMVCLPGKVIVIIASQMFLLQSQLKFITKFHLT